MDRKIKRGDTVVLYSSDKRHTPEVTEVTGIGKKYITVRTTKGHNRYGVGDLTCVDWSCWKLFHGTLEEYEEYEKQQEEAKEIRRKLLDRIRMAEYAELKAIDNFLGSTQYSISLEAFKKVY